MLQPPRPNNTLPNKEISLLLGEAWTQIQDMSGQISNLTDQYNQIANQTPAPQVTPQAVNQLWNGSFSHSVNSWVAGSATDNSRYECQSWFSHPVVTGQAMFGNTTLSGNTTKTFTDTDVDTTNDRITISTHGFVTGQAVLFTSASPPAPLVTSSVYYIIVVNENRFKLATSYANAVAGTAIDLTTIGGAVTDTLAYNYTLKTFDHSLYSPAFSDWSWGNSPDDEASAGTGRFQGSYSIDAPLVAQNIQPGYTYYGVFNIVKQNQYVTCSGDERIWCGLYANQSGGWDWVKGDFTIDYEVQGTVATPIPSRDYRILCTTDRGFTVRSSVLTVANAPSDTDFSNGATVFLSWRNVLQYGVQTYQIYRKTGGTYVLLQTVVTGQTSTLDNGSIEASAAGWPSATFDSLVAYTATIPNVIESLPYSGDPLNPLWATIPFTLKVPQLYDMSATDLADYQWLRWGFSSATGNLDLRMTDGVMTEGDATLTSASGQFTADQVGLTIIIRQGDIQQTTTIASYTSSTEIELTDVADFDASEGVIYIYNGAPAHAIWIDLAHLSWQLGAAFAPAAADVDGTHGIPPVTPNGTTQGGAGGGQSGGSIDGQPVCLFEDEMVATKDGDVLAKDLRRGMKLPNGYDGYNTIEEVTWGISDVWMLTTENGVSLRATETKQIFTSKNRKKVLAKLEKGDKILTMVNGVLQPSLITSKAKIASKQIVVQIRLKPAEKFLAGVNGYVLVSNAKPIVLNE